MTDLSNKEVRLYTLGYEPLEAEINSLTKRENDDAFIKELRNLQRELNLLEHNRKAEQLKNNPPGENKPALRCCGGIASGRIEPNGDRPDARAFPASSIRDRRMSGPSRWPARQETSRPPDYC